jgi:hypothetical protein
MTHTPLKRFGPTPIGPAELDALTACLAKRSARNIRGEVGCSSGHRHFWRDPCTHRNGLSHSATGAAVGAVGEVEHDTGYDEADEP